ncbi:MAG TPA: hypothetical protein VET48_11050 [Steroidobacteraceae bacterium]|nr:hypothetical protein [Steroidobacteraceae bacterium]
MSRKLALSILFACGLFSFASADEDKSVKETAKEAGHDVGQAIREAGHETKKAVKKVGHATKTAVKETGHAVHEGAKELKKAVKGEDQKKSDK